MLSRKDTLITHEVSGKFSPGSLKDSGEAIIIRDLQNWALSMGLYFCQWELWRQVTWFLMEDGTEISELDENYLGKLLNIQGYYFLLSTGQLFRFDIINGVKLKSIQPEQLKKNLSRNL